MPQFVPSACVRKSMDVKLAIRRESWARAILSLWRWTHRHAHCRLASRLAPHIACRHSMAEQQTSVGKKVRGVGSLRSGFGEQVSRRSLVAGNSRSYKRRRLGQNNQGKRLQCWGTQEGWTGPKVSLESYQLHPPNFTPTPHPTRKRSQPPTAPRRPPPVLAAAPATPTRSSLPAQRWTRRRRGRAVTSTTRSAPATPSRCGGGCPQAAPRHRRRRDTAQSAQLRARQHTAVPLC